MTEFRIVDGRTTRVWATGIEAHLKPKDTVNCAQLLTREADERRIPAANGLVLQAWTRTGWIEAARIPG